MASKEVLEMISHLPGFYQSILLSIHPHAGLPIDQINMLLVLVLQAIAGSIYRRLHGTFTRRLFGLVLGFLVMYTMYGVQKSIGITAYVVLMYYPIVKLRNARISFWLSMGTLFSSFCYIAWFDYLSWKMDFTTSLMGITIRLHTLTWDLIDYDKIKKGENLGKFKRFATFRREHACNSEDISLFNYMAYMLFFVHILCGSNLTINEFMFISDNTIYQRNGWRDTEHPPDSKLITKLKAIGKVLATAAVYLFGQHFFNFAQLFDPVFQQQTPFWKMMIIVPMASTLNKFKYHFGWKMLDLCLLTSGAGFSGVDYEVDGKTVRKIHWERGNNIRSLKTALPQCTADVVRNWNMTVNDWLTFYVFYRIEYVPKFLVALQGEKGSKVLITRIASAIFHGVYPTYYLFFFCTAVITNITDLLRLVLPTFEDEVDLKKKSPFALKSMLLFAFWVIMIVVPIDSVGVLFMELDLNKTLPLFKSIYWFPMLWAAGQFVVAQLLLMTVGMKQSEKEKRKAKREGKTKKEQ